MSRPTKAKPVPGARLSVFLQGAWTWLGGVTAALMAFIGFMMMVEGTDAYNSALTPAGLGLMLASPAFLLVPLTVRLGLQRADEIAELLRKIAARDAG